MRDERRLSRTRTLATALDRRLVQRLGKHRIGLRLEPRRETRPNGIAIGTRASRNVREEVVHAPTSCRYERRRAGLSPRISASDQP